jgi:ribonuclease Z
MTTNISEVHGDHSTSLPYMICRRVPPTIYLPEVAIESCRSYLDTHVNFRLHGQDVGTLLPTYTLQGVKGGEKLKFSGKQHADKLVEVFDCDHSVTCVGYGFLHVKKKIKPEYVGVEGKQLGLLRRQGVEIDTFYESPMFAFMGDTTTKFYAEHGDLEKEGKENIFRYPLIITECTFLGTREDDSERAEKTKHTLWTHLKPFVESHPNVTFVLIHFSHRYGEKEIREFFAKENLVNVVPFVEAEDASVVRQAVKDEDEY